MPFDAEQMWSIFSWLGVIGSALSLFRLANLWLGFRLSQPAGLVLNFYAAFLYPIVDRAKPIALSVVSLLSIPELPSYWHEVAILYVMIALAMVRFLGRDHTYQVYHDGARYKAMQPTGLAFPRVPMTPKSTWFALDALFALAWPILPVVYVLLGLAVGRRNRRRFLQTVVGWVQELAKIAAGLLLFVFANAAAM